jgi:hypothetical protein
MHVSAALETSGTSHSIYQNPFVPFQILTCPVPKIPHPTECDSTKTPQILWLCPIEQATGQDAAVVAIRLPSHDNTHVQSDLTPG